MPPSPPPPSGIQAGEYVCIFKILIVHGSIVPLKFWYNYFGFHISSRFESGECCVLARDLCMSFGHAILSSDSI